MKFDEIQNQREQIMEKLIDKVEGYDPKLDKTKKK